MMDLGSGIALAGFCVSGGAVAITAIRTFSHNESPVNGTNGKNGVNGKNGLDAVFPCKEHSGLVESIKAIGKTTDRQEKWMYQISEDIKKLLKNTNGT